MALLITWVRLFLGTQISVSNEHGPEHLPEYGTGLYSMDYIHIHVHMKHVCGSSCLLHVKSSVI